MSYHVLQLTWACGSVLCQNGHLEHMADGWSVLGMVLLGTRGCSFNVGQRGDSLINCRRGEEWDIRTPGDLLDDR